MNLNSLYLKVKWFVSLFWGMNWTGEIVAGWEDGHFCHFHYTCVFDVWGAWFLFIRHEFSVLVGACNWGVGAVALILSLFPWSIWYWSISSRFFGLLLNVWWGSGQVLGSLGVRKQEWKCRVHYMSRITKMWMKN